MKHLCIILLAGLSLTGILSAKGGDNPLLKPYNTPFNVPPFDQIKTEHFMPAFEEGMKQHNAEIKAIVENKEAANFKNTIEALEKSGSLLNEVATVFYNLTSANTNKELQQISQKAAPLFSKHSDNISMNMDLFKKVKAVYQQKDKLKLTSEQSRLLDNTYKSFVRNGADLDAPKQAKLREINEKLSLAELKFGENLLAETNGFQLILDKKEDLAGLPQSLIDAAADDAAKAGHKGKWMFTLQNPSVMPFLQYSSRRDLREKMYKGYSSRGNQDNKYDNKKIINDITNLRIERSNLLGFNSYADYVLEETMAKTPANVYKLMDQIWAPALEASKKEAAALQTMIDAEGGNFKVEPWDWRYYTEKLRKEKYDLDEEQIRPYLKLENVRDAAFMLAGKLYGLKFVPKTGIPKYHEDCMVYEVLNPDGSHLSILYMDFHPRASKRGGAWMTNYREQYMKDGKNVPPVVSLVCNFSKPNGDTPSLLTFDEAETLFHEFGHGLHGMLSKCNYRTMGGTNVSRDFVELPSQVMENWVGEPEMLALFAKHYKTGEIMPKTLVEKIQKAGKFNMGFVTVEFLAAAYLDMAYHTLTTTQNIDVNAFEKNTLDKLGLIPQIISRYKSTYFNHAFPGGYSAGYYSYIWAGVLDSDAFEAFKEHGLFDKKTADAFRQNVLERGNTEDPMELYKRFRGAEPSIKPLLKKRGLL